MEFADWFKKWFARHPLKEPPRVERARYTAEVMAQVRSLSPSPVHQEEPRAAVFTLWWPRLALGGLSVALMAALVVFAAASYTQSRLAKEVTQEAQVLAALNEPVISTASEAEEIVQEIQATDTIVLAEATQSDDQWLEETFQLLDQLDESKSHDANESSDEDWLGDLQMLDDHEVTSSS